MKLKLTKEQLLESKILDLEAKIKSLKIKKKYGLVWEDKPEEVVELCKTNIPVLKEVKSKEIITDESRPVNILIEGDNYHSLSVLNYTHQGKVDVIYIDPPYNTGNQDFKYNDKYVDKEDSWKHSEWLSFMSRRLSLAKNLLNDNGSIFISIDDNEQATLKLLCDEVFGSENFVGMFCVENNPKGRKNGKFISVTNEYCLIYVKRFELATFKKIIPKHAIDMAEDEHGDFIRKSGKRVLMGENTLNKLVSNFNTPKHYSAYIKDSDLVLRQEKKLDDIDRGLIKNGYRRYVTFRDGKFVENTYTKEKFKELFDDESLDIREDKIYEKHFSDLMQIKSMLTNNEYEAVIDNKKVLYKIDLKTTSAKQQLAELLGKEYFSFPKNISFIKHLISLHPDTSATILDFFAGSGTTGHAVLEKNLDDNGNRRFILCTNNENSICEDVTFQRLKKVISGYKKSNKEQVVGLGGNLKYFKTTLIPKSFNRDEMKIRVTEECTEMLCVREGIYEEIKNKSAYKIFKQGDKIKAKILLC